MRFWSLSAVTLFIIAVSATKTCKEGETWKEDCNSCSCMNGQPACTLMACKPHHHFEPSEKECEEGTTWKDDCNDCHCMNGLKTCTMKGCPGQPELQISKKDCEAGEHWMEDCNHCHCHEDKIISCTRKKCESTPHYKLTTQPKSKRETRDVCSLGDTWKEDCNSCHCTKDGKPACTKVLCESDGRRPALLLNDCKPGERWQEDCNNCTCNDFGKGSCTRVLCESDAPQLPLLGGAASNRRKRETEKSCKPGERWQEDCNNCTCNDFGKGSCTRVLCESDAPKLGLLGGAAGNRRKRETEKACKPGERWQEDCNNCTCNDFGKGSCTRVLCESDAPQLPLLGGAAQTRRRRDIETEKQSGLLRLVRSALPPSGCQPGQHYKDDCNDCICQASGPPVCTLKLCLGQEKQSGLLRLVRSPILVLEGVSQDNITRLTAEMEEFLKRQRSTTTHP